MRVAVAGLGGFAASHHAALAKLEAEGHVRVVGACDPAFASMPEACGKLKERGVPVFDSLEAMIRAARPEIVTLPTPIPLHAPMHRAVVRSGAACYLEKPPTLWWPELQEMIAEDSKASHATQVGFNFIADPMRTALKHRILDGEFGPLQAVTLRMVWPRDAAYYGRNDWAGRLKVRDRWVLDSPIGNAMAHYIQNALYWCGPTVDQVGSLLSVRAILGRVHPIDSYDTAFVSAEMENGATIRIAATHAQQTGFVETETLHLRDASIEFDSWRTGLVRRGDGRQEVLTSGIPDQGAILYHNLQRYARYVRGLEDRTATSLKDSRSFVALCGLALVSAGTISEFPESRVRLEEGRRWVEGLDEELFLFAGKGIWPGLEPRSCGLEELSDLEGSVLRIENMSAAHGRG